MLWSPGLSAETQNRRTLGMGLKHFPSLGLDLREVFLLPAPRRKPLMPRQ